MNEKETHRRAPQQLHIPSQPDQILTKLIQSNARGILLIIMTKLNRNIDLRPPAPPSFPCPPYSVTSALTTSQSPPSTKLCVVAPLWPLFTPCAGLSRKERNPVPQPPPLADWIAVVLSPARMKAGTGGLEGDGVGVARVIGRMGRVDRRVSLIFCLLGGLRVGNKS